MLDKMKNYNNDVIARENSNEAPDGLDHDAGVVGPGDAVRDRIGELPMRWWS